MRTHHQKAFTLLEVLIAMMVLALSLLAAIKVATEVTTSAIHMQDKTLAQWVAMNKIAEMRLQPSWPSIGRSNGRVEMANRSWHWQAEVKSTEDQDVRRLEVAVLPENEKDADTPTVLVTAFLGKPL